MAADVYGHVPNPGSEPTDEEDEEREELAVAS
jgi:hypothetical protein